MKKVVIIAVTLACISISCMHAQEDIRQYKTDTDILWLNTAGKKEGIYDAVSLSMLKWGVFLVAVMGTAACVVHQSTATTTTSD